VCQEDYGVLYDNIVLPVICEGEHFTHMWKTLAWSHHFTKGGRFEPIKLV